ncbi:MAG: ABC transporter permease [Alphaproteobacteria bacterium]|nr:ABC transporter permease [Alphaproteobacteria bacterium SS10]
MTKIARPEDAQPPEEASQTGAVEIDPVMAVEPKRPLLQRIPNFGLLGWLGIAILTFWTFIAIFGPALAPYGESEIVDGSMAFSEFGEIGAFGLDYLGRDVLSRLMYGTRTTLGLALAATIIAFVVGGGLGIMVAIIGGQVENITSRFIDAIVSFPAIMLALVIISAIPTADWRQDFGLFSVDITGSVLVLIALVITVGLIEGARVYRIARALAQDIMAMDFVEISLARGESKMWVLWNEIMPNSLVPLSTEFGLRFTYSILLLSGLSFLGLGVQPPFADWGVMVRENTLGLTFAPHTVLLPAIAIYTVTLAVNFLVDWNVARSNENISDELVK